MDSESEELSGGREETVAPLDELLADETSQTTCDSQTSSNCYCERARDLSAVELQCCRCLKWFHALCLQSRTAVPPITVLNYTFVCLHCNGGHEAFARRQTNFSQMCETSLVNLMRSHADRQSFSKDREIIPFIEQHWEALTTMPRRIKQTWHNTVVKTMAKETDVFIQDSRDPNDPHFALRISDLSRVGPNYADSSQRTSVGRPPGDSAGAARGAGRGAKRKLGPGDGAGECLAGKTKKSELSFPRLPANGFPQEFPFNKDGYRYYLAEPDPHGPHRQEFEDSLELAGKPIPGWLCRKLMPDRLALSLHDRAPQLRVAEDRRVVLGDKGYCAVRANLGVARGDWFFEVRIDELPDGAAVRLGWAQELANLQAPLGYDKFGYSVRSRKGTRFHDSRGKHFLREGLSARDVIGLRIELPSRDDNCLPLKTFKDKPLVKFKSFLYFEDKDDSAKAARALTPLPGARISVFKNGRPMGTAFDQIFAGQYFPAVSLYKSACVAVNFGPQFECPPAPALNTRPMSDLVLEQQIEQTLAEILYFVEHSGQLRLDIFYGT